MSLVKKKLFFDPNLNVYKNRSLNPKLHFKAFFFPIEELVRLVRQFLKDRLKIRFLRKFEGKNEFRRK